MQLIDFQGPVVCLVIELYGELGVESADDADATKVLCTDILQKIESFKQRL